MPSKSRAQQRLMQSAEHGAQFPMAQKIRQSMTHRQMHDFAVGSEQGKPQHVKPMHPAMVAHGQKVKATHAHLAATSPRFRQALPAQRMQMVQNHIRRTK